MDQNRMKLIMAGLGVLVSLVLIVTGTLAWFTLSQKPEVTGISVTMASDGSEYPFELSLDGENWTTELHVDSALAGNGPLRPISTADLVHWYLPSYGADGGVNGFSQVALEDVANRSEELTSYLMYFDLWVRTRDQNTTYALKLNNPNTNADGSLRVEDQETVYGTYALWLPEKDSAGVYKNPQATNDAMACLRIGFQMMNDQNEVQSTLIFEPNADMRSSFTGYTNTGGETSDVLGSLTYVVGSSVVSGYSTATGVRTTLVPTYSAADGGYTMAAQNTFKQGTSEWDTTKLAALGENDILDSRCIASVGAFEGTCPALADISIGTPQKIRVYLWLEGQDVDCWNQIAGGGIYANLEFRGDAVATSETPST